VLEGADDLFDRRVLLGVKPFFPPHHEVGAPRAERRHHQRRSHDDNVQSVISLTRLSKEPLARCPR
jgi:hypothetical protein